MSDKLSELLPCPFCGGRASSSQQTTGGRWAAYCLDCEAMVDGEFSEPDAIAAWNRRASPAPAIPRLNRKEFAAWLCNQDFDVGMYEAYLHGTKAAPAISESDELVALREMLDDARTEFSVVRMALGVEYEPHQTVFERTLDAARKGEKS